MKEEVSVASKFLIKLIETTAEGTVEKERLESFQERLQQLLCARFENHWFPDSPAKGQAYRCIRVNEIDRRDPILTEAASSAGLSLEQLQLPDELTIWVDPKEVCCRFGEHQGSFCTLATFKNGGSGEIFLDQVNFDEIRKKSQELKDKVTLEMSTRKNGRRGFLSGSLSHGGGGGGHHHGSHHHGHAHHQQQQQHHHGHPHHPHGHHGGHGQPGGGRHGSSPNGFLVGASPGGGKGRFSSGGGAFSHQHHHQQGGQNGGQSPLQPPPTPQQQQQQQQASQNWYNSSDMFSSSPPNHFSSMYGLAKFSPPKYGYGSPSKWSSPVHGSAYGPPVGGPNKGDKYHWFNSKTSIKA